MVRRCHATGVLGLLTLLSACAPAAEPFLLLSGPKDLIRIEVRDTRSEVVWSIEADEPKTLSSIVYGELPEGFVQLAPEPGTPPRPLVDREPLVVRTATLRREFTHYGFARGPRGFQVNHSEMKNLGREVDAGSS